jgi:hypothetical protein
MGRKAPTQEGNNDARIWTMEEREARQAERQGQNKKVPQSHHPCIPPPRFPDAGSRDCLGRSHAPREWACPQEWKKKGEANAMIFLGLLLPSGSSNPHPIKDNNPPGIHSPGHCLCVAECAWLVLATSGGIDPGRMHQSLTSSCWRRATLPACATPAEESELACFEAMGPRWTGCV